MYTSIGRLPLKDWRVTADMNIRLIWLNGTQSLVPFDEIGPNVYGFKYRETRYYFYWFI